MTAKTIPQAKAADILRRPDHRLMKMHIGGGVQWFIIPAGPVTEATAMELLKRPDIVSFDDGLFPGNPQSWKIEGMK